MCWTCCSTVHRRGWAVAADWREADAGAGAGAEITAHGGPLVMIRPCVLHADRRGRLRGNQKSDLEAIGGLLSRDGDGGRWATTAVLARCWLGGIGTGRHTAIRPGTEIGPGADRTALPGLQSSGLIRSQRALIRRVWVLVPRAPLILDWANADLPR
jgi:hypothetical protein